MTDQTGSTTITMMIRSGDSRRSPTGVATFSRSIPRRRGPALERAVGNGATTDYTYNADNLLKSTPTCRTDGYNRTVDAYT